MYGTRGGPYRPDLWGGSTRKGNTVYLHITQAWPGGRLHLPPLPHRITASKLLTGGEVKVTQADDGVTVEIAPKFHQPTDTVVALELDGDAMDIKPIPGATGHRESLAVDASVTASSETISWAGMPPACVVLHSWEKGAPKTTASAPVAPPKDLECLTQKPRGHLWRFWMARENDVQPWIAVDMGMPHVFDRVVLREKFNRIRAFKIQVQNGGEWRTIHAGTELDLLSLSLPQPLSAQKVRLLIDSYVPDGEGALRGPGLQEFDVYLSEDAP